ncbi:MAG: FAD-dependent oxidoreductase [SAR202 cluster bacterium]|nr:FAD-dependent oxidoreductase [SAR202 cluster bacterium]
MSTSADVVVLGAGAAGCATAYFLAREGVRVRVIERESIGSCASGYAQGMLNPLTGNGIPGPNEPLAIAGFNMHRELWPVLQEEAQVDIQARMVPQLDLCFRVDEIDGLREEMERWDRADGFSARWLGPDEVHRLEPRIAEDVKGAVLLENVGMLDSYRYTLALAQAAERHGAEFVTGEVVGLRSSGGRATGVAMGRGDIPCQAVVIALGPWSGRASDWLGLDIPVEPLKGQMIYLEGLDPPLEQYVHGPGTLAQKVDGNVWIGATEEHAGFDTGTTVEARDSLVRMALEMVPSLGRLGFLRQTACLRPVTPDSRPIIGRLPGWDGVFLATGAEKKGILFSPAMGRAVADLILTGNTSLSLEAYSPERFS